MPEPETHSAPLGAKELYEYHHRIAFACQHLAGLKVLDLFCGSGDGSAKMAAVASEVVAVDPDGEAISRGIQRYKALTSLTLHAARVGQLPFEDGRFDAVVSVKALSQGDMTDAFLGEIRRVLSPEGFALLSISTDLEPAQGLPGLSFSGLDDHFPEVSFYGQRMVAASSVSPLSTGHATSNAADYRGYRTTGQGGGHPKTGAGVVRFANPEVFICLASGVPTPHVPGPDSIFLMDAIDIWAELATSGRQSLGESQTLDHLTAELRRARARIDTLTEVRESLERSFATAGPDLAPVGPMMEELAGEPIPADMPNLVKLLGAIAVRFARHETELERVQTRAEKEISALKDRRRTLRSELDEISLEAEEQAEILAVACNKAREETASLAAQVQQQSELLNEVLQDLEKASNRETAALEANALLSSSRDDLLSRLAERDHLQGELRGERDHLQARIEGLEQALAANNEANAAIEADLRALETSRQGVEQRLDAALVEVEEALLRETVVQSEILRQLQVEAELTAAYEAAAAALAAKNGVIESQGQEIARLGEVTVGASAELAAQKLAAEKLAGEISELQSVVHAYTIREQDLNAEVLELSRTEAALSAEIETLASERAAWTVEKAKWQAENACWSTERAAWDAERDALALERKCWASERDGWKSALKLKKAELEAFAVEMQAWRSEREAWALQQEAWASERHSYQVERVAWAQERESWGGERNDLAEALAQASDRVEQQAMQLRQHNWWERIGRRSGLFSNRLSLVQRLDR